MLVEKQSALKFSRHELFTPINFISKKMSYPFLQDVTRETDKYWLSVPTIKRLEISMFRIHTSNFQFREKYKFS